MHAKGFVQISEDFSEGVSLQRYGPLVQREHSREDGNSFVTAASFVRKFVPRYFVTTLIVDDELKYFESISLERRTVMQNFSETVNVFPKDRICSRLLYQPNATTRRYIAGIKLYPAQKCVASEKEINLKVQNDGDAMLCGGTNGINGDVSGGRLINGEV